MPDCRPLFYRPALTPRHLSFRLDWLLLPETNLTTQARTDSPRRPCALPLRTEGRPRILPPGPASSWRSSGTTSTCPILCDSILSLLARQLATWRRRSCTCSLEQENTQRAARLRFPPGVLPSTAAVSGKRAGHIYGRTARQHPLGMNSRFLSHGTSPGTSWRPTWPGEYLHANTEYTLCLCVSCAGRPPLSYGSPPLSGRLAGSRGERGRH